LRLLKAGRRGVNCDFEGFDNVDLEAFKEEFLRQNFSGSQG